MMRTIRREADHASTEVARPGVGGGLALPAYLALIAAAVMSLGANGCPDEKKCAGARAIETALCKGGIDSDACARAQAATIAACPIPEPTAPAPTPPPATPPPTPAPTPTPVATPTPAPPTPGCEPMLGPAVCRSKELHEIPDDDRSPIGSTVDGIVKRACVLSGGACEMGGEERPGAWDALIFNVGEEAKKKGLCPTYDYGHGENGRASEASFKRPGETRVYNFQLESSGGKVRTTPGSYRGYCDGGGEGQPIRPPAGAPTPEPTPTPKPSACGDPRPTAPVFRVKAVVHDIGPARVTLDTTVLFGPDAAYCKAAGWSDGRQNCQLRPEGAPDQRACEEEFIGSPTWDSPLDADRAGFLLVVPKINFRDGETYTFVSCFVVRGGNQCGSISVSKSW